jgi:hypothetical protein
MRWRRKQGRLDERQGCLRTLLLRQLHALFDDPDRQKRTNSKAREEHSEMSQWTAKRARHQRLHLMKDNICAKSEYRHLLMLKPQCFHVRGIYRRTDIESKNV